MRSMSGLVKNNSERLKLFVQQLVQVDQKDGKTVLFNHLMSYILVGTTTGFLWY